MARGCCGVSGTSSGRCCRPTTFFLLVTNMTYAFFETYATIDYLTPGGGPLQSTTTMMYQVIQLGVDNNDLGKAAAQSIVLFLMVIGMTLVPVPHGWPPGQLRSVMP